MRRNDLGRRTTGGSRGGLHAMARSTWAGRAVALGALALCLLTVRTAAADACASCRQPTTEELEGVGMTLEVRSGFLIGPGQMQDKVHVDAGACTTSIGTPEVTQTREWTALRVTGEVWNCPHSKSSDKVVMQVSEAESSAWTLKATTGGEIGNALVGKVLAKLEAGESKGATITEIKRVEKTITAQYCRRVPYKGHFTVGEFVAKTSVSATRTYAWWTKNFYTGATVHQMGEIKVKCGSETVVMDRRAAIGYRFDLSQKACQDEECKGVIEKHVGTFGGDGDDDDDDDTPVTPGTTTPDGDSDDSGDKEPAPSSGDGD